MKRLKRCGGGLGLAMLALCGCGQSSQTVMVQLTAHGAPPAGLSSARVTLEEIKVLVDVPGMGPQWRQVLSDEEGARTFDLMQVGAGALVAERDLPAGKLLALRYSLDTDEAPEAGVLALAPGYDHDAGYLGLPGTEADATHLSLDFDLAASLIPDGRGGATFKPTASAAVMP